MPYGWVICLPIVIMETSCSSDTTSTSDGESDSNEEQTVNPWNLRLAVPINDYNVTLQKEQQNRTSQMNRECAFIARRDNFLRQYDLDDADGPSVINTQEATDLRNWCQTKSWSFCEKCGKLSSRKFLQSFRTTATCIEKYCKFGSTIYSVPQVEDVLLLLRNLSANDIRVLRPFDIHCGEYKLVVHGYRQRTGPFRVNRSAVRV